MGTQFATAIPAALAAAATFAVSAVLQQRAARQAPEGESLSWRLIADLLHRKTWLAGVGCVLLGYLLQAVAFGSAPIAVVEPVVGVELVLALPLAARLKRRRLGRREWAGAALVMFGVGAFLALSSPAGGNAEPALSSWGEVALPALAGTAICLGVARMTAGSRRATLLAVVAGVVFAVTALLTQSLVELLRTSGFASIFETWQLYALAIAGPLGFTVAQSAYQAGPLAQSLPVIDSLEPSVSVVLAAFLFGQWISFAPLRLGGEMLGAALAVVGIFLLTRSPLVLAVYEQTEQQRRHDEPEDDGEPSLSRAAG